MSGERLTLTEIRGTPALCGAAYCEEFATRIIGFGKQSVDPTPARLAYARRCWKYIEKSAPTSAAFLTGMARAAGLSRDVSTLIALHEEIVHQPHCTAFVATGEATRGGETILAQNWDWSPALYPWPGLLRLAMTGGPRMLTYHYPGLWACAGVNEAGLGLVWTGGGYMPKVAPVDGVPTYVLISEILRQPNVEAALACLNGMKHAGSFIFFLGDASGATAVVEAVPGKKHVDRTSPVMSRGNHYLCADIIKCGKQIKPSRTKYTTLQRSEKMTELLGKYHGEISPETAKQILTDRSGDYPWLNQFPGGPKGWQLAGMTIDSFFVMCNDCSFWTCRGGATLGPWQSDTP